MEGRAVFSKKSKGCLLSSLPQSDKDSPFILLASVHALSIYLLPCTTTVTFTISFPPCSTSPAGTTQILYIFFTGISWKLQTCKWIYICGLDIIIFCCFNYIYIYIYIFTWGVRASLRALRLTSRAQLRPCKPPVTINIDNHKTRTWNHKENKPLDPKLLPLGHLLNDYNISLMWLRLVRTKRIEMHLVGGTKSDNFCYFKTGKTQEYVISIFTSLLRLSCLESWYHINAVPACRCNQ